MFKKVLIANRGEIALRVIRAGKELAIETVAGYSEADRDSLHTRFADDDGCIRQAAAGGGGKGMRVAQDGEQFPQAFSLAKQEALAAFGSDEVYLEKYLARPRHIEIQIMGDTHGRIMHLCERDCSVQRRHQKLVEEAPSPVVDATLRHDIGDAAVRLAGAIGYVGGGTIEFPLDEAG